MELLLTLIRTGLAKYRSQRVFLADGGGRVVSQRTDTKGEIIKARVLCNLPLQNCVRLFNDITLNFGIVLDRQKGQLLVARIQEGGDVEER